MSDDPQALVRRPRPERARPQAGEGRAPWLQQLLYRPLPDGTRPFRLRSTDGVGIAGYRVGAGGGGPALVYAHGFLSGSRHRRVPAFLGHLSRDWTVYAFDFRGHGASEGLAGFAGSERQDLDAVVALARRQGHRCVIAVGSSMGGATAIRHAAKGGAVDAVVTIGAYARATPLRRRWTEALRRLAFHPATGARLLAWSIGARMGDVSTADGEPEDWVAAVAPRPLLLLHGGLDPLIPPADARRLAAAAGPRAHLVLAPFRGHDQPHLDRATAALILAWAEAEGLR